VLKIYSHVAHRFYQRASCCLPHTIIHSWQNNSWTSAKFTALTLKWEEENHSQSVLVKVTHKSSTEATSRCKSNRELAEIYERHSRTE